MAEEEGEEEVKVRNPGSANDLAESTWKQCVWSRLGARSNIKEE